jgi:actin-related protein 9
MIYIGFTPSLLATLQSRYVLSPSTATIFTSELPSNFTTPVATPGTNTPIPGQAHQSLHHPAHGVNPLLVAATKNMMQPGGPHSTPGHLQVPGGIPGTHTPASVPVHEFHHQRGISQSPTSIKTVKPPEYFPEWKNPSATAAAETSGGSAGGAAGWEEASFLGAQVAAKVVFIVDGGISKGFLSRGEFNDLGPAGILDCAL